MTIYFLRLKEWLERSIDEERKSLFGQAIVISGYYFSIEEVKKLEAEFECKSLAEAGYF